ncbi:hypothetical protein [Roseiconus lacunae]|uniref:hypothetical protein n=1 Tax=Roseiconus lacunae TaxID=2605694 RepID=UPI001E3DDA26|nr:hypothetical protein [Roseiconus lacunae]MCD0459941.1 hypothetical protein [Roseiconus lacunae]
MTLPSEYPLHIRERCDSDLAYFLPTVFPVMFFDDWTMDQRDLIHRIESAGIDDEVYHPMPSGAGSTSIILGGAVWLAIAKRRPGVTIVSEDTQSALQAIAQMKAMLVYSRMLHALYPDEMRKVIAANGNLKLANDLGIDWTLRAVGCRVSDRHGWSIRSIIPGEQAEYPAGTVLIDGAAAHDQLGKLRTKAECGPACWDVWECPGQQRPHPDTDSYPSA